MHFNRKNEEESNDWNKTQITPLSGNLTRYSISVWKIT